MNNKVRNPLPIPEHCDQCASLNVIYTDNSIIYGRNYGEWPKCYYCEDCGAAVGCHPGTTIPLGRMTDRATRQLRKKAHDAFDPLWKNKLMERSKAYEWLARQLGIEYEACHISQLSKAQLAQVVILCKAYHKNNASALLRRKAKTNAKQFERNEREHRKFQYHRSKR